MTVIYLLLCLIAGLLTPLGGGYLIAQLAAVSLWLGTVIFAVVFYGIVIILMIHEFHIAPNKD